MYSWGEGLDAISCSVKSSLRWEGKPSSRPEGPSGLASGSGRKPKRCPVVGTDRREVREHSGAAKRRDAKINRYVEPPSRRRVPHLPPPP